MKPESEKIPPNLVARTGIQPVSPLPEIETIVANQQVLIPELGEPTQGVSKNRPQTGPTSATAGARLSRQDLRDLMGMCDRQVGYCGVSDPAGQRALELKAKLLAIHAHGWHETTRASANHQRRMITPPAPAPPAKLPPPPALVPPEPPEPGSGPAVPADATPPMAGAEP